MANSRLGRGFAALISDMREIDNPEIATYDEKGKLKEGVIPTGKLYAEHYCGARLSAVSSP